MDPVCIGPLLHISCHVVSMMFGLVDFPPGKKPEIKLATYKVVNDFKPFISQKDNTLLKKILNFYATQRVDEFIKENKIEWDFAMTLTEMNKEHYLFGGDFKILLMSIIYNMPIIIFMIPRVC